MHLEPKTVAAFSEEHTSKLSGVSQSQLRYWDRTNFYRPSFAETNRRLPFSRIYSFKDIVALRVLNALRNECSVSLHHLREVSKRLGGLGDDRWTGHRLYVVKRRVVWVEPGTDLPQDIVSGQYIVKVVLSEVVSEASSDVAELNRRDPTEYGVVKRSRFISHNEPVIAGTRIPVGAIKRFAAAGYSPSEIIGEYPDLTERDVEAALSYEANAA